MQPLNVEVALGRAPQRREPQLVQVQVS